MTRWASYLILTLTTMAMVGCSTCAAPHDFDYPTYGGIHQRSDPTYGRLGSLFSDPNTPVGPSADSNLEAHPEAKVPSGSGSRNSQTDDEFDRANEDLDDDLEDLDDELEELDRKLEQLDGSSDDLEQVEPLEDINTIYIEGATAKSRWRQRGSIRRRGVHYR